MNDEEIKIIQNKIKLADFYYDNFMKYYRLKIFSKASEFLWGSLNALVYALGVFKGIKASSHQKIIILLEEIAEETKDKKIREEVNAAETLHANFFHDFMDENIFEENKNKVQSLLDKLRGLLNKKMVGLPIESSKISNFPSEESEI